VTATCLLCTGVSAILVTDDSGRAQAAAGTVAAAAAVGDDCSRAGVCTAAHSASLPAGGADTAVCAGSVWLVICCSAAFASGIWPAGNGGLPCFCVCGRCRYAGGQCSRCAASGGSLLLAG